LYVKTTYIMIDYENVMPEALAGLDREENRVIVFVGASQTKVHFQTASLLQDMGERAEYVKISGNGPNALDFHIAFYVGQISARDPDACFRIISNDAGFDPLIQHLKSRNITCRRDRRVTAPPPGSRVKAADAVSMEERVAAIVGDLRGRGKSRPGSLKTLTSTIHALFQKRLSEAELAALVAELQRRGLVRFEGEKPIYALPDG
jgi:hypothetical protein